MPSFLLEAIFCLIGKFRMFQKEAIERILNPSTFRCRLGPSFGFDLYTTNSNIQHPLLVLLHHPYLYLLYHTLILCINMRTNRPPASNGINRLSKYPSTSLHFPRSWPCSPSSTSSPRHYETSSHHPPIIPLPLATLGIADIGGMCR